MRSRVYRYYTEIREIDEHIRAADIPQLLAHDDRLRVIDDEIAMLRLPLAYRNYAYSTRLHIDLVRNRINERSAEARG